MEWTELSITVNKEAEQITSSLLQDYGSNGVAIEDSEEVFKEHEDRFGEIFDLNPTDYPERDIRIKAYFNETQFNDELLSKINAALMNHDLVDPSILKIEMTTIKESDWENEWKHYFHPFKASDKFFIVPSWELVEKDKDYLYIELDPGMAFGTGDHPTTSLCLKALERVLKPNHRVIDVGTGSGILSIASYLLGAKTIKAIDLDEMAVKVAKENFEKNHCLHAIQTDTGNLLQNENGTYDVIIANILAHIIEKMIEDAFTHLDNNGLFIASGIIEEKEYELVTQLKNAGFEIHEVQRDSGWICIISQKVVK
ncbi:50S ribosomal protein L11 methyltransferase [Staphylococcus canis]|uniref:Ribosomal protein L11 methyltransferase n=1 Tax=Staphylococcus canis TaxID=2724942 RepID=A0ABS0TAJ4_9STAP|nr:50S ribosomal protein L11 methyltransferase [Staphylococcus canis]MBI5975758.1 50S ribosomal protein L11 methyltransferase [Staphylococcus canis]